MTILTPEDAKRRRQALGLSRRQLAARARLACSTIRKFEELGVWPKGSAVSEAWRKMLHDSLAECEANVLANLRPGEVAEVVRVPHGTNAPQGFAHLPPSRPSHHDRFSTKAARKVSP